jgi:putative FmdB family regulatory protein
MPIYEYRCSECGFQDEFLQKLSEPLLTVCPSCGKESFKKLLSAAGFQLKGSGWYATDFKSSGSKPEAKADKTQKPDAATSTEGPTAASTSSSSETAPAAKSESSGDKGGAAKTAPAGTSG